MVQKDRRIFLKKGLFYKFLVFFLKKGKKHKSLNLLKQIIKYLIILKKNTFLSLFIFEKIIFNLLVPVYYISLQTFKKTNIISKKMTITEMVYKVFKVLKIFLKQQKHKNKSHIIVQEFLKIFNKTSQLYYIENNIFMKLYLKLKYLW